MTRAEKVAKARELRAEGLTYREIGERLGRSAATIWAWLHPEKAAAHRARWEGKPGVAERESARKREWENLHDRRPCAWCGAPRGVGAHRDPRSRGLCATCRAADKRAARDERYRTIASMWNEGMTAAAIAAALDSTPGSVGVTIVAMRAEGWDLPYRYKTGKRAGRKFPEQVAA